MNDEDLITRYLLHAETVTLHRASDEHFEAFEEIEERLWKDPERAWPVIREIIQRTPEDRILAYVAAGPLEDLLVRHPYAFIDRIESLAREDDHFRRALSGVWGWNSIPEDVRKRLDNVIGDEPRL